MEDQLSLAIGRDGQNARLAAKLTAWRIDIKSLLEAAADALHRFTSDPELAFMAETEIETVPRVEAVLAKKAEGRPVTPEEYQTVAQFVDRVERGLINRRSAEKRAEDERRKAIRTAIPEAAFATALEDLQLSERIFSLLQEAGYQSVGDLLFQHNFDADSILALDGIGPKYMQEIQDKLSQISFPEPVEEIVVEEPVPETESPIEQEAVPEEPVLVEPAPLPEIPEAESLASADEITSVDIPLDGLAPIDEAIVQETAVDSEEAQIDETTSLDELFTLRPEEFVVPEDDEEEDDESGDKSKAKGKKKKRRFVEVVYDPDRDVTIVKRKRKRGGELGDEWEF